MGKKLNKTAKSNAVTYGIVIAAWAVMMVLQSQGMVSNSISRSARSGLHLFDHGSFPEPDGWYFR